MRNIVLASVAALLLLTGPAAAAALIGFDAGYRPGTIVISQHQRKLYYVLEGGRAVAYPVAVAKRGKEWSGAAHVEGKYVEPAWSPPDSVKHDHPELPDVIPGGSPRNPMGVAAMTLAGGEYAIHGTNMPGSVGGFVSYGCIRMLNSDIADLYSRVSVGTTVVVSR